MKRGLQFVLPLEVQDKDVSVIEVGPSNQQALAEEINKFLGTRINGLVRTDSYVLVHDPKINGFANLLQGKPFVDPIIQRATLDNPLIHDLGIDFDYILQSNLNPGTSDAFGHVALYQALLSFGKKPRPGDNGFHSLQYFLRAKEISQQQIEEVSAFLANPDLNQRTITTREEFERGRKITVPVVTLNLEAKVETFDIINMNDDELVDLSSKRRLAGSLEEMQQFRDEYKNPEFIKKRKELGLNEKATDVELETWFGLRSEHCFHKEFNARITLKDNSDDPIFRRAYERGILTRDGNGNYVLERGIFKTFVEDPAKRIFDKLEKRGKNWILSMFEDNSGVVAYNEDFMFCIKYETHNSPSNKEPVQGAKTGIDGVNRDIFGTMLGTFDAISNFFLFCTGDPSYRGWLPKGVKHPYMILKGETQGVREGGNESQIATLGGGVSTDPRYLAKTLCHCGTIGFSRRRSPDGRSYEKKNAGVGDKIILMGQAVGVDGVHGATESSLSASANISLGHVQADFSFCQAKEKDYILECARRFLFKYITDCGAMGLGSAAIEMSRATGGLEMELDNHPKKYLGIQPFQIICSETQNRMVASAESKDVPELKTRAELHEVDVTELGTLTDTGYVHLKYKGKTVALIDINNLFNKEPKKQMSATWNGSNERENPRIKSCSLEESLCDIMEQPDVASKEWFFRQKDSSVKGATIQGPLIGLKQEVEADATIQKPLETERKDFGAIAYALGFSSKLSDIDPYYSSQKALVDMIGKIIAVGGRLPDMKNPKWDAWAVCGNYCQPNSDSTTTLTRESGKHNLASLVREGIGVSDVEDATNIPIISGKDSMKCSCQYEVDETFRLEDVPADLRKHITLVEDKKTGKRKTEIHDPDSYLASCAVKIEDYRKCVNSSFKQKGDLIFIVGTTKNELGSSQYLNSRGYQENKAPYDGGAAPKTNLEEFVRVCEGIGNVVDKELIASCSYIHNGGLLTAVAKAAIAGEKGAEINPSLAPKSGNFSNVEEILYSETPGRFIVTVDPNDIGAFEKAIGNLPYQMIGIVSDNPTLKTYKPEGIEDISLTRVKTSYQKPLRFDLDVARKQNTTIEPQISLAI